MRHTTSTRIRLCARISSALLVAIALVLVPTVMRARQHFERRDTTRLSIRLNWQSDAPPRIVDIAPADASGDAVVPTLAQQPHPARVALRACTFAEIVARPPFDNAPELLRGPPTPSSPSFAWFVAS